MTMSHARAQLDDLIRTVAWIRTLTLDGPRYKLWLGDVVEFVHTTFGPASAQMAELRALLVAQAPLPRDAAEAERTHRYLSRLDALERMLTGFARRLADPIVLMEPDGASGPGA